MKFFFDCAMMLLTYFFDGFCFALNTGRLRAGAGGGLRKGKMTMNFIEKMKGLARGCQRTIVLPEGSEPRTVRAAAAILRESLAGLVLLGDEADIRAEAARASADISGAALINPGKSPLLQVYADRFAEMRKSRGVTPEEALETMKNPLYYGVMMVEMGDADGMVAGAINSTGNTLRPALQILKTAPGFKVVSSFMVVSVPDCALGAEGTFVFADIGLNENPDEATLAEIAVASARSFQALVGEEPRVAMLSYSTYGSAKNDLVTKVQNATKLAREMAPDILLDGEMQADAAIVSVVGLQKAPGSVVAGRANVLVFPDLNAGNIGYKLVERLAGASAFGPILQGVRKPVNDLSRGCSVEDIVGVVAITAVQAR